MHTYIKIIMSLFGFEQLAINPYIDKENNITSIKHDQLIQDTRENVASFMDYVEENTPDSTDTDSTNIQSSDTSITLTLDQLNKLIKKSGKRKNFTTYSEVEKFLEKKEMSDIININEHRQLTIETHWTNIHSSSHSRTERIYINNEGIEEVKDTTITEIHADTTFSTTLDTILIDLPIIEKKIFLPCPEDSNKKFKGENSNNRALYEDKDTQRRMKRQNKMVEKIRRQKGKKCSYCPQQ